MSRSRNTNEKKLSKKLLSKLKTRFSPEYRVSAGKCLLYKLIVDGIGEVKPKIEKLKSPKRGQYAFETDLLVEKINPEIPLVVIELKSGDFSTHDVITYSAKALQHKTIYPYLRYGFLVVGRKPLREKFLNHNYGIDFAIALSDVASKENKSVLIKAIENQIKVAEKLARLNQEPGLKFSLYETIININ